MADSETLNESFDELGGYFLDTLKAARRNKTELPAALLREIRQFLADNKITAVGSRSKPAQIVRMLPFDVTDDQREDQA